MFSMAFLRYPQCTVCSALSSQTCPSRPVPFPPSTPHRSTPLLVLLRLPNCPRRQLHWTRISNCPLQTYPQYRKEHRIPPLDPVLVCRNPAMPMLPSHGTLHTHEAPVSEGKEFCEWVERNVAAGALRIVVRRGHLWARGGEGAAAEGGDGGAGGKHFG